jgi:hypothetical protein
VTSAETTSLTRCGYCGKEFDVRKFQVVVARRAYDSTECALQAADSVRAPREVEQRLRTGVETHV